MHRAGLTIGQTGQMPGASLEYENTPFTLEHKTGIDLTVSLTLKAFKKLYRFYFETFRIISNPSSVRCGAICCFFSQDGFFRFF